MSLTKAKRAKLESSFASSDLALLCDVLEMEKITTKQLHKSVIKAAFDLSQTWSFCLQPVLALCSSVVVWIWRIKGLRGPHLKSNKRDLSSCKNGIWRETFTFFFLHTEDCSLNHQFVTLTFSCTRKRHILNKRVNWFVLLVYAELHHQVSGSVVSCAVASKKGFCLRFQITVLIAANSKLRKQKLLVFMFSQHKSNIQHQSSYYLTTVRLLRDAAVQFANKFKRTFNFS